MKKEIDVRYVAMFNADTKQYEVNHVDDGPIMDDLDSILAANAVAQLACLGNLRRGVDGILYIDGTSNNDDVLTMEEFVDSLDDLASDDSPTDEDTDYELCAPTDALELSNVK